MPIRADCCASATFVSCFASWLDESSSVYRPSMTTPRTTIVSITSMSVYPRSRERLRITHPEIEGLSRPAQPRKRPPRGAYGHRDELDDVRPGSGDSRRQVAVELLDGVRPRVRKRVPPDSRRIRNGVGGNRSGSGVEPVRQVVGEGRRVRAVRDRELRVVARIAGELLELLARERVCVRQLVCGRVRTDRSGEHRREPEERDRENRRGDEHFDESHAALVIAIGRQCHDQLLATYPDPASYFSKRSLPESSLSTLTRKKFFAASSAN